MGDTTLASGDLVEGCARAAVDRVRRLLGDELVAAYLIGSGALGGAVADQSDVDVVAVCAHAPLPDGIRQLVDTLTEEAMSWPMRGLEWARPSWPRGCAHCCGPGDRESGCSARRISPRARTGRSRRRSRPSRARRAS